MLGCPRQPSSSNVPPPSVPLDTIGPTDASINSQGASVAAGTSSGSFSVTADGAATYTIPLWVPTGRQGVQPRLELAYHSRAGNGPVGVGWSLTGLPQITRCKQNIAQEGKNQAIQFDNKDRFCLGGQKLVSIGAALYQAEGTEYRTEDDSFTKVVLGAVDGAGPRYFTAYQNNGLILSFATQVAGLRVATFPVSLDSTKVETDYAQFVRYAWALSSISDRLGNRLYVNYSSFVDPNDIHAVELLPSSIQYTFSADNSLPATRSLSFSYEARPDVIEQYVSGFHLRLAHRIQRIDMSGPNPVARGVLKSYILAYNLNATVPLGSGRSRLSQISECDGMGICLNPVTFEYEDGSAVFYDFDTGAHINSSQGSGTGEADFFTDIEAVDLNGDGCDDLVYQLAKADGTEVGWNYRLSPCFKTIRKAIDSKDPTLAFNPDATPTGSLPIKTNGQSFRFVDMDLDGRPDFVGSSLSVWRDQPYHFLYLWAVDICRASDIPPASWNPALGLYGDRSGTIGGIGALYVNGFIGYASHAPQVYIADLNGDGYPDLLESLQSDNSDNAAPSIFYKVNHGVTPLGSLLGGGLALNIDVLPKPVPGMSGSVNNYMVDIDGDGTTEALLRSVGPTGKISDLSNWYSTFSLDAEGNPRPSRNIALVRGEVLSPQRKDWFVDLNGDGLPDSLSSELAGGNPFIAINTGNGFLPPTEYHLASGVGTLPEGAMPPTATIPANSIRVFDYDGDGKQDVLPLDNVGSSRTGLEVLVQGGLVPVPLFDSKGNHIPIPDSASGRPLAQLADVNGDGLIDIIEVSKGDIHVYVREGDQPDTLVKINDRGVRTDITYRPLTDPDVYQTTVPPGSPIPTTASTPYYVVNHGPWVVSSYARSRRTPGDGNYDRQTGLRKAEEIRKDHEVSTQWLVPAWLLVLLLGACMPRIFRFARGNSPAGI